MRIAIHQPNFCPYEGFWNKMKECDLFVIMTHSQFRKGGFENRFNYQNRWFTMSVNKGLKPLTHKSYVNHKNDWNRIIDQLPKLSEFSPFISSSLVDTNYSIIHYAGLLLNISTPTITDLKTELSGTDRLVEICQQNNATEYLSGPSGKNYLEMEKFHRAGIEVLFQEPKGNKSLVELI